MNDSIEIEKIQSFFVRSRIKKDRTQWVRFTKLEKWRHDAIFASLIAFPSRIQEFLNREQYN